MIPSDRREEAERVWRSLEERVPSPPLACSSVWTLTWLRHYGDAVPHQFAVAEDEDAGDPRGVALLTREERRRGPFKLRRLHIGTAGEPAGEGAYVERNGVLTHPSDRQTVAQALLRALNRDRSWDELVLDGFRPDHAYAFLNGGSRLVGEETASPCLDVRAGTGGVESLLALLRSKTRKRIRSNLRTLGPIFTEWAESPEHALDIFDEMCALHQADWEGRGARGAFGSRRFRDFHRDLVSTLVPRSALMFRARTESGTIGCLYGLIDGDDVLSYQAGIARSNDNRVSLGLVTHVLCMSASADRGFRHYDFLAGDASYKRRLTTTEGKLVWASARRMRARVLSPRRRNGHG